MPSGAVVTALASRGEPPEGAAASTTRRTVIVRPDRYVFGHTTETLDLDALLARLAALLCLR